MALEQILNVTFADHNTVPPRVYMVKTDTARVLTVVSEDYTIPSGATATLKIKRSNGTYWTIDSISAPSGNRISFYASQMLTEVGITEAMLQLVSDEKVLKSFVFLVDVQPSSAGEPETEEQGKTFEQYVSEAESARDEAVTASESAQEAAEHISTAIETAITPIENRLSKAESVNTRQQIEIDMNTAFRKDKYSIEVSDSSVAYEKDVPVGALPWGEVKSIGGMSQVIDGEIISANLEEIESRGTEGVIGSITFPAELAEQMHGINSDVYDKVELVPRVYSGMKKLEGVSFSWNSSGYWSTDSIAVAPSASSVVGNVLSDTYFTVSQDNLLSVANSIAISTTGRVMVHIPQNEEPTGVIHYEAVSGGEDYEAVVMKKKCGIALLKDLTFTKGTTSVIGKYRFESSAINDIKRPSNISMLGVGVSNIASIITGVQSYNSTAYGIAFNHASYTIFINGESYNDMTNDEFRQAMEDSNAELIYELATPKILDVTEYFTDENYRFIEVEGGGTITFKQTGDYKLAIPSVVEYDVKVVE